MIFVLYPLVTDFIDIQKSIGKAGSVPSKLIETRDKLILMIIGFIFLYIVLAFGFKFIKIEQQQEILTRTQENESIESKQTIKPAKPKKTIKPLNKKTQTMIAVLSTSVFMLVFVWQVFSNIPAVTMDTNIKMFFMEQVLKGIIASVVVGIVAYLIAKYR